MGACGYRACHTLASGVVNARSLDHRFSGRRKKPEDCHRVFSSGLPGVYRGLTLLPLAANMCIFLDSPLDKILLVAQILVSGWRGLVRVGVGLNL